MDNDIEKLLKLTIKTKIIEAFNSTPEMIEKLVQFAISKDVDPYGKVAAAYEKDKMPYMDWLVGDEICRVVRDSVRGYVESNQDQIRSKVKASIENSDFSKPLSESLAKIISEEYRWHVDLKISKE